MPRIRCDLCEILELLRPRKPISSSPPSTIIYYYFSNQGRYNIHIESDEEHGILLTQAWTLESKVNAIIVVGNTVIITDIQPSAVVDSIRCLNMVCRSPYSTRSLLWYWTTPSLSLVEIGLVGDEKWFKATGGRCDGRHGECIDNICAIGIS